MAKASPPASGHLPELRLSLPFATLSIAVVVASVLVFQPGGQFRFVWVKLLFLVVAGLLAIFAQAEGRLPRPVKLMLAAAAAWIAAVMLLSDTPAASIAGRWPRYEGVLTLGVYAAVFVMGAKLLGRDAANGSWRKFRSALAVGVVILALVSALEAAGLRPLGGGPDIRPGAFLGNATDQGLIGLVAAGVLAVPRRESTAALSWLRGSGFAAAVLVVFLSGSRAALLGLGIVVMVATLMWLRNRAVPGVKILPALALVLLVGGGTAALFPTVRARLFSAETIDGRWLLWDRTWNLVADHLWFGLGPSGFVDAFPAYMDRVWAIQVGDTFPTDSPHNLPLQLLAAGGVPLLILAAGFAGLLLFLAVDKIRRTPGIPQRQYLTAALAGVAAYSLALMTHFTSPGTTGLVAFICGGLVATPLAASGPVRSSRAARTIPKAVAVAMAVAGLTVITPAMAAEWPMAAGARSATAGDMAGADASFQTALRLRPWDSDTSLMAGQAFAGPATSGDAAAASHALKWGNQALERTPRSLEAGIVAAIGSLYSGDLTAAKDRLDDLAVRAPHSASVFVQRGVANFGLGLVGESIADLENAASLDPSSDTPWLILAGVYERLGNYQGAGDAMLRARELAAG